MNARARLTKGAAKPRQMRFADFSVRAWREGPVLHVLAHSTPAGGMRQPVAVKLVDFHPDAYRVAVDATLAEGARIGRRLASLVLPTDVWRLVGESLQLVAARSDLGLRFRLCLDDDLIDLPWELLYRPDVDAPGTLSGFLLMDGRISLVREPPSLVASPTSSDRTQRGLFVGTLFDDGTDRWGTLVEYASLAKALVPLKSLIDLELVRGDAPAAVESFLRGGCDVFHYAGHTDLEDGRAVLVELASSRALNIFAADGARRLDAVERKKAGADAGHRGLEAVPRRSDWSFAEKLAPLLGRAGTRLAMFNACNSGYWSFVRPFMRAGIPAVIGAQGLVSNLAALNFAEKLYQSLAVGLSIDEAMTYARCYLATEGRSYHPCDWSRFMVYLPTDSAVLFPRSERPPIRRKQQDVRAGRDDTLEKMKVRLEQLDGADVSRMLSDIAARSVLILGRFTAERKAILDTLRKALATPPRHYLPMLFDFEKPGDRDLIESIVRFASVSRFVIADLSDPKSVPAELQAIVPQFPSLPVIPIIEASQREYPVADSILRRDWVHPVVRYESESHLVEILDREILEPAESMYTELRPASIV
ncbi:MAG TPA: CHAT domain-containing protein [Kofleriaceae bacterium]